MSDTHQAPSLKEQNRVLEDMYERVRLLNLRLTKQLADVTKEANHLQAVIEVREETIRDLREKLKVTVRR